MMPRAALLMGAAQRGGAGLPDPPFLADLIGAWHWSEGVTLSGSDVTHWANFAGRSTYTLATNTTPHPTVGARGLDFAEAGMLTTIGTFTHLTALIDFECTSALPDAVNIVRLLSVRNIGTNGFGIQHQQAASPAQTVLNGYASQDSFGATAYHPLLNPEVPAAMVDGAFAASYESGVGYRSRTLRRSPPGSSTYDQGLSALGTFTSGTDAQLAIGRWVAGVFAGTIKTLLVYDRASSNTELGDLLAYAEGLR